MNQTLEMWKSGLTPICRNKGNPAFYTDKYFYTTLNKPKNMYFVAYIVTYMPSVFNI